MLASCDGNASAASFAVRDSAGVRIVANRAPIWRDGGGWQIEDTPVLDIGTAQGDEAYQLFDARMALRQSDGTIVVLNYGTQQLRFYDAQGVHVRDVGRRGRGPGEYLSLEYITLLAGDSILAFDRVPARVTILAPDGAYVRSTALPRPERRDAFPSFDVAGMLDGRRLVVWSQPIYGRGYALFDDGINRHPHPIGVADLQAERFDSVALAPGWDVWVEQRPGAQPLSAAPPFARSSDIVAQGETIYIAPTDEMSILMLDANGAVRRIVRALIEPTPVTGADMDAWRADLFERFDDFMQQQRAEAERLLARIPTPTIMPAFRGLDVDRAGNLWVHGYPRPGAATRKVDVFNADGHWLGAVQLPAGLKRLNELDPLPLNIGEDWILGVWRDEFDVDHVRLYMVEKEGGVPQASF